MLFLAASFLLNITPGPDLLYITANSIASGKKAGVVSALGITAGTLVHTLAVTLGLSVLLARSPFLFDLVRYAGAAYLIYLGARTVLAQIKSGGQSSLQSARPTADLGALFHQGIVTNVLNPKVALFFLAFLPQFVDPTKGAVALQFFTLGCLFNLSATIVDCSVGLIGGQVGDLLRRSSKAAKLQGYFTGSVFLALGARLALVGRG